MTYVILIYESDSAWERKSESEQQAEMKEYFALSDDPAARGGHALQLVSTAKSVRVRDDFLASLAAYCDYDVLLVNPVMDGLNLVAKEAPLVNRRDGAVVLSTEAGAFEELGPWTVAVDPRDVQGQAAALAEAIALPREERHRRLVAIRTSVRSHDIDAWSERELAELDERAPAPIG